MTSQSGSVTGLTKDGKAVASTNYNLSGARKTSTDTTGDQFSYNGEARDDTGLDYLRARYYDSQVGAFLSEDSSPGEGRTQNLSARTVTAMCRTIPSTTPTRVGTSGIVSKGWNYVKKTVSNAWNGEKYLNGGN